MSVNLKTAIECNQIQNIASVVEKSAAMDTQRRSDLVENPYNRQLNKLNEIKEFIQNYVYN